MQIHHVLQADILIIGGSTAAVDFAIQEKAKGRNVLIVTGFTYFGEDRCATLNCGTDTPMTIKRELDRQVITHDIPFRFRSWPLKLTDDALFFGNSEGIFAVQAGIMVDFTQAASVARMTAMDAVPFQPGAKAFQRTVLRRDKTPEILHGTVAMKDDSISSWEKAEIDARQQTWSNTHLFTADFCRLDIPFQAQSTDPQGRVFLPGQLPDNLPLRPVPPVQALELGELPHLKEVQVLIVGGGTAGAPAGIAAGRHGASALILEEMAHPGGTGTEGRIACYWYGLTCGYTAEIDREVQVLQADQYPEKNAVKWSVECKQHYLEREITKAGTEIWYQYTCCGCQRDGNRITGAIVAGPYGSGIIDAQQFIDSTGNANLATYCGAPTVYADQFEPAVQGAGMCLDILGRDYMNTDYMFTVDASNQDTARAFIVGRDRHPEAYDLAKLPGTRERRRIVGEITLQPTDFYRNNRYSDTICMARSNFDTHGFTVHPFLLFNTTDEEPKTVQIPMRALLSPNLENLMTTGLGVSAHRDAMPLIRMQADVQNQGYAAGLAATMAVQQHVDLRQLDMASLQKKLVDLDILPQEILRGGTVIAPEEALENAKIFHDPDFEQLHRTYAKAPDFEQALRLALLNDDTGKNLLQDTLRQATWDEGWNYRGMGQFGMSSSRLDVAIIALAGLSNDFSPMANLLKQLTSDHAFSHIRACCHFLMKHPDLAYASDVEHLLSQFDCHAIQDFAGVLDSPYTDTEDVTERNYQLKEIYLAGALHACQPDNELATSFLERYANGVHKFFAIYAEKYLKGNF